MIEISAKKYYLLKIVFISFLTGFLFIFPFDSFCQEIKAEVTTDTNSILIGDHVHLNLKLQIPAGFQYSWPEIDDTLVKYLPVISRSKRDTAFSEDKKTMTISQKIRFTSFDSGYYLIPSFTFLYRHLPAASVETIISEPIPFVVHTLQVDTSAVFKPIKGPMKIPLTFREMLPWIISALVAILIIAAVVYYLWKRKKAEPVFQLRQKIKLKPEEIALMELEKLKSKKLWQNNKIKDYHTELTDIIRKYIEDRFDLMAMEKTSAEIFFELEKKDIINKSSFKKLEEILTTADMVKFAKSQPLPDENETSMQFAIEFVKETTQLETIEKNSSQ